MRQAAQPQSCVSCAPCGDAPPPPYTFDSAILPYRVDVLAWSSVDGSGGMTYTRTQHSGFLSGGIAGQANLADGDDGDYMEWNVLVAAGTYTLTFFYYSDSQRCKSTWSIDGVDVGTVDLYGAPTFNVVGSISGIAIGAGNHTLRARANGKNASSTDYLLGVTSITLTRTGA